MPAAVADTPGPFTTSGTRIASSNALYHFCCSPPCAPSRSPWSEVNTTIVSSAMPDVVERVEDPPDRLVDQLVQVVVEAPVREVGGLLVEHLRPHGLELLLARRPSRERVGLRRRFGNLGHGVVGRRRTRAAAPTVRRRTRCRAGSRTTPPRATARRRARAASSPNSSTTCSANTPSRTAPQSAFAAP